MVHYMNMFVVVTVPLTMVFTQWFPVGLWIPVITGSFLQIAQTQLLRDNVIRRRLGIGKRIEAKGKAPNMMDTWKWAKESWDNRMETAKRIQEERKKQRRKTRW